MKLLIDWYLMTKKRIIGEMCLICIRFCEYSSISGWKRTLSRLLSTLLLMKHGYKWIQYVSFEHEIESRKTEYYRVLRSCQSQRPSEDVTEWIRFFFNALGNIQKQLMIKLENKGVETRLSPREKSILTFIESNVGCKSGDIAKKLEFLIRQ